MSPLELRMHRRNTKAFIDADPLDLVLTPYARVDTDAGGFKITKGDPREPLTVRLIPSSDKVLEVKTLDGRVVKPEYTILAEHDAVIAQLDRFTLAGTDYEIVTPIRPLHTTDAYERKGDVVRRG